MVTAENGLDALDKLQKTQVDVLLADLWMPKMNGVELVKEMRKHHQWDQVLVGAVSGDTVNDKGLDLSCFSEVLHKSLGINELKDFFKQSSLRVGKDILGKKRKSLDLIRQKWLNRGAFYRL